MSKSVKVSEEVYQLLMEVMRTRETFSEVIQRLLKASVLLSKIEPLIREGRTEAQKHLLEQIENTETQ